MSTKNEPLRRIDQQRGTSGAAGLTYDSVANSIPPAMPAPPPPTEVTVGTMTIGRSAQAPIAIVPVTWRPPEGLPIPSYLVEVADDSAFASVYTRGTALEPSASLELPTGRTFYLRVYAQHGASFSSASATVTFTTPADTTAAPQPTGVSASFIGSGDLEILWTNPAGESFRDVEIKIWNSSGKTTLYHTGYDATGRYVWTAAQNRAAGSGTPDPVVYYELRSRTWSLVLNNTSPPSGTVTKAAPATPGSAAADFTGPDAVWTWNAVTDADRYRLTIDDVARDVYGTRYSYSFTQNGTEHSGTPDPSLAWSLVAIDGLDQVSATPASGTATNAAPSAPSTVTLTPGMNAFMVSVSATQPADFLTYRYRVIQTSPDASDVTFDSPATLITREVTAAATYQVGVRVVDMFGQTSTETLSSTAALDALALADLRADLFYSDSDSNTFTHPAGGALAALKDGVTDTGGVTYAA